jgi:hypothetical protein
MNPETQRHQYVSGADLSAHFNVRCPSCTKLYRVESKNVHNSHPEFNCKKCFSTFSFLNPPQDINNVKTFLVQNPRLSDLKSISENSQVAIDKPEEVFKKCPRCGLVNPRTFSECLSCHAVFNKEITGLGPNKMGLTKAWQELVQDYTNLKKHFGFVEACTDLNALPYALKKYEDLKSLQPSDPIVDQMLTQIRFRAAELDFQRQEILDKKVKLEKIKKIFRLSPLFLSGLMLLLGILFTGYRNMIGFSVALLFIHIGLKLITLDNFKFSDIFK